MPSSRISPADAAVRPSSMRMSVVLPAPFGPRNPNATPAGTRSSTSWTAVRSPKRLVRPEVSTTWLVEAMSESLPGASSW